MSANWLHLHREEGNSFVELALVLPMLILLFLGMIDFGLGYNTYITLNNGAREGVRWITTNPSNRNGAENRVLAEIQRAGLDADDVTITFDPNIGNGTAYPVGTDVSVTITHDRQLAFGIVTGFPSVTLRASATMRVLY